VCILLHLIKTSNRKMLLFLLWILGATAQFVPLPHSISLLKPTVGLGCSSVSSNASNITEEHDKLEQISTP
jgi:hypothetical protein